MMGIARAHRWAAWAAVVVSLAPSAASGHFERVVTSSRRVALGGAYVAVASDASSSVISPAGLSQVSGWSVLSTYDRPFGLSGTNEAFIAGAMEVDRVGAFGLAWHHTGLTGVLSENLFTIAFARDLIRTSEDASLSVGVSADIARVEETERFGVSETHVTAGASVLLRPFPAIGLAYAVRNIREPEFDLVAGGGATVLERTQAWGVSYRWHESVTMVLERRDDVGGWRSHFGVEIDLGPYLDVRSGVGRGLAAGGVGIAWRGVTVDAGFASHEYLGSSYVLTLGYSPLEARGPHAR